MAHNNVTSTSVFKVPRSHFSSKTASEFDMLKLYTCILIVMLRCLEISDSSISRILLNRHDKSMTNVVL